MRKYLSFAFVAAMFLLFAGNVQAGGRNNRDNQRADRHERIGQVIKDCEQRTNEFLRAVDKAWGRDRQKNDKLDRNAEKLERAMNQVRDSWNRNRNFDRTRSKVNAALSAGQNINKTLQHHRLNQHVLREWEAIRAELDHLADVFEYSPTRW
jgi:hypothetical protein